MSLSEGSFHCAPIEFFNELKTLKETATGSTQE